MCACMPFFPAVIGSSPTLQKCVRSVQSLRSTWTLKSSHTPDVGRGYQKHVSGDGSEDGVGLHGRGETATEGTSPESPKKIIRMEVGGSERDDGRPASSWMKL